MRVALTALLCVLCCAASAQPAPPTDLVCEWRAAPSVSHDPCPEFAWAAEGQARHQVVVSLGDAEVWDSGWVDARAPVAEYAGPPLEHGKTYTWRARVEGSEGRASDFCPAQEFRYEPRPLPRRLPHIRTFVNFGANAETVAQRYDLTFRSDAKQHRPEVLAVNYSLLCTMVVPSEKADALEAFCIDRGLTEQGILEEMFLHFSRDTKVTLHVGAERAENPRETRTVPGWDPLGSPEATAREMSEARVPIYYWGPPRDDFVMNVGHPEYQAFCADAYVPSRLPGFDGIWVDTMTSHIPGPGQSASVHEYPPTDPGRWRDDMLRMLCTIKRANPDMPFLANNWSSTPFVIDGAERENWLNISSPLSRIETALAAAAELDRRGAIQMLQVNPVFDPEENEFGQKVDVEPDRDRIFALGVYYLVAGERTYFGFGQHPYRGSEKKWFDAIEFDVGAAEGERYVFAESAGSEGAGENLLVNGDFEADADGDLKPDTWELLDPVELDAEAGDGLCARIESADPRINNINRQYVTLRPNTTYTLFARVKTEGISGGQGAQVYPYEFDGAEGAGIGMVLHGTHDWAELAQVFTTGDDPEGRISFRVYGSLGTAWFDDIRLVEGAHGPWRVLGRDFENALVLVKPFTGVSFGDESSSTHALPEPMRPLHADGSLGEPTSEITLRGGEAAILAP